MLSCHIMNNWYILVHGKVSIFQIWIEIVNSYKAWWNRQWTDYTFVTVFLCILVSQLSENYMRAGV